MKSTPLYKQVLACLVLFTCIHSSSNAQSCDPWIVQAYKQLYQRNPTSDECNIRNYHNGSWSSYNELVEYIKTYNSNKGSMPTLSGDPWIFQAYKEIYNRQPNAWELNIRNYNNGSWNSYSQLKNYIIEYQNSLSRQNLEVKTGPWSNNNVVVGFFLNGQQVAVNIVASGAGNVIAAGGGNVIAAGGGNVIAAGGGNVIAAGGGNIAINAGMAGVSFGSGYSVQSTGARVVSTSGKGTLVIK